LALRKADTSKTQRFTDGPDHIEFRTQLTAGDEDFIKDRTAASYQVDGEGTVVEVEMHANRVNGALFAALVVGWSLEDGKPTLRDYEELTPESRKWVDQCVNGALATVEKKRAEGKASRAKPRSSRSSSARRAVASSGTPSPRKSSGS
jgi:hypothetical protein